ncbi:MAG TPA: type II secretion system F family protein [Planctomycetes bacterium]|nr:type II secretion system F family protein [Planctomycetota bacterium]HIN80563.1 type II secretion system F family protein [Planctomycetota bacterium]
MKSFEYRSKNQHGKAISGKIEAHTETEAVAELRRRGLTVMAITSRRKSSRSTTRSSFFRMEIGRKGRGGKVRPKDLVPATRQLATMISAGIPIVEALEVLEEQSEHGGLKQVFSEVVSDVRGGKDLSQSLAKHPKVFGNIYVSMIKAGEASGQLDIVLDRLAIHLEESETLKGEIKAAMTYPVVSLIMIILISIGLLVFILPQFATMFTELAGKGDGKLPLITRFVMGLSDFTRSNLGMLSIASVAAFFFLRQFNRTPQGKRIFHWIYLKTPVFGPLFTKVAISRFSSTFATLIRSGVPILGALEIVETTTGNVHFGEAIRKSSEAVRRGEPLGEPMARTGRFPPMVTRMIGIGERSGSLELLLDKISSFYDSEVRSTVKQLTALIEPFLILAMGIIVGTMVGAMFLPILSMMSELQKH